MNDYSEWGQGVPNVKGMGVGVGVGASIHSSCSCCSSSVASLPCSLARLILLRNCSCYFCTESNAFAVAPAFALTIVPALVLCFLVAPNQAPPLIPRIISPRNVLPKAPLHTHISRTSIQVERSTTSLFLAQRAGPLLSSK